MPAGQPTKYNAKIMPEQAYKLCQLGATDVQLGDFFGVCEDTINNWKKAHSKFFVSIKKGKGSSDSRVTKSLFKRALGYEYEEIQETTDSEGNVVKTVKTTKHQAADPTSMIFWSKNRMPAEWRDNKDITVRNFDDVLTEYLHGNTDTRDQAEPRLTKH